MTNIMTGLMTGPAGGAADAAGAAAEFTGAARRVTGTGTVTATSAFSKDIF
jgi:hypothetical protein